MIKYSRRTFLTTVFGSTIMNTLIGKQNVQKYNSPNVIYIVADDLGWADLSCYGRKEYKTPNLDWLADNGVKFTNAYSAAPVSTPSRCAFVTGRYPARIPVGLKEPLSWKKNVGDSIGLDPAIPTIASLLKENNYQTVLIGKWHLGYLPKYSPLKSGYTDFFGNMSGGVDYFTHKDPNGESDLYEDERPIEKEGYLTDLITERAVSFISQQHEKPFFLSLNYTAPHWPWEGPDDIEKSKVIKSWTTDGGSAEVYGNMVKSLDAGIGKVLSALRKANIESNTIIIFTSDNGGERFSYNWPFSGGKFQLLEGGIRVPAIIYWKDVIPKGKVIDQVSINMDWTKTILNVCHVDQHNYQELDGIDLFPIIMGEKPEVERKLFWRTADQNAVRHGRWKYYKKQVKVKHCMVENEYLFDLKFDQMEQTDFKEEQPEIFLKLKDDFMNWEKEMLVY
jgi:arylsulfatase A-like enzyme